jgi:hypothetical protein
MQIFVDALEADSRFTEVLAEVMPVFRQLDADKRTVPVLMGRLQKALDSRIDARMESTLRQAAAGLTIGGASSAKGRPSAAAEVASQVADGKKIWMPRKGGKKALQAGLSMMDQSAKDQTLELLLEEKGLTGQALGGAGRVGCIGQVEEGVAAVAAAGLQQARMMQRQEQGGQAARAAAGGRLERRVGGKGPRVAAATRGTPQMPSAG